MRSKITNIQFEKAMHDMRYTNMRLAKHLEVHPSIISKWLRGDRPSDENMLKLEFVFGKRVAYWWIKKSVQGKPVDVYQAKDVVKCIDDLNIKGIPNIGLTKGVLYRVEDVRGLTLLVKDDYGAMIWYAMSRFQRAHVEDVVVQSKRDRLCPADRRHGTLYASPHRRRSGRKRRTHVPRDHQSTVVW
jgi:plasmid maintenance system antidote protein VapI